MITTVAWCDVCKRKLTNKNSYNTGGNIHCSKCRMRAIRKTRHKTVRKYESRNEWRRGIY